MIGPENDPRKEYGLTEEALRRPIEYKFLKDTDLLLGRWINYTVTSHEVRTSPADAHSFTKKDRAVHVARILEETGRYIRVIFRDHDHAIMGEFPARVVKLFRETQHRELAPEVLRSQIVITKSSVRFINEIELRDQFYAGYKHAARWRGDRLKRRPGMFANKYAVLVVQDFNYLRRDPTWEKIFVRPFVYDTDLYQNAFPRKEVPVKKKNGEIQEEDELQVIGVSPRSPDQLQQLGFFPGKLRSER